MKKYLLLSIFLTLFTLLSQVFAEQTIEIDPTTGPNPSAGTSTDPNTNKTPTPPTTSTPTTTIDLYSNPNTDATNPTTPTTRCCPCFDNK